jgi:hypothetical protein
VRIDGHAGLLQLLQQLIQIVDPVVDHEAPRAGTKIAGVARKMDQRVIPLLVASAASSHSNMAGAIGSALDRQMLFVPFIEFLRRSRFEKDATDSSDLCHNAP